MKFSERLRQLRIEKGLTQDQLAKNTKLSHGCIAMLEVEKRAPTGQTLEIFADFFECSVDYLLGREDDFGNVTVTSPATEELTYLEKKLLTAFAKLDASEKDKIIYDAEYFASKHAPQPTAIKKPLIG